MTRAYYNEYDPQAAEWIRQLIKIGAIPDGQVDDRSIADVQPDDLRGFTQCHFFAGVAGWPEALRRAGVPADRPLWTGSCPCQSFSCAGKQQGIEDPRDLWPHFFRLIRECRPVRVFGEQVASAIEHGWLDRLSADLEAQDYAVGAAVLGAHSAGADHQRQRLYWMAESDSSEQQTCDGFKCPKKQADVRRNCPPCGMADATIKRIDGIDRNARGQGAARHKGEQEPNEHCPPCGMAYSEGTEQQRNNSQKGQIVGCGTSGGMEDAGRVRRGGRGVSIQEGGERQDETAGYGRMGEPIVKGFQGLAGDGNDRNEPGRIGADEAGSTTEAGDAGNFWSNAIAIPCRDGKARRFEPGIFPLVAGLPRGVGYSGDPCLPEYANATPEGRVMRLKGYGNAINVEAAAMFITAAMTREENPQ